jgi:hypothetical protein
MSNELDVLTPSDDVLTLSDGTRLRLVDLKARQFFKLLKILTHGPAMQLMAAQGTAGLLAGSEDEILGRLVAFIGVSIPDSFDEVVGFLYDMVEPADLRKGTDKKTREDNAALQQHVAQTLSNPDPEDMVDLIEAIVRRESADLAALGKKVMKLLSLAQKTGQLDTPQSSPAQSTSEVSSEPSTLS